MSAETPTPKTNAPSILLAEDSEDDAFFFQRALKKSSVVCGFIHAGNGKIAIEALQKANPPPILIFLDLKMPVMSGFDVLEWLKASALEAKPRVVILSGSNDQADRERALSLGASDYLVKPIVADELRRRIFDEVDRRQRGPIQNGEAP